LQGSAAAAFFLEHTLGLRTPLYDLHVALGARIVDFGGWDMPVNYGSQIDEHHAVRRAAGVFDVSHMCVIDLRGERVHALAEDTNMYAAIDALTDKLERLVRKHKEKITDHHAAEAQKSARL